MSLVRVVLVAAVVLCLVMAAVVIDSLAGADEPPSLGRPVLVVPATMATASASGSTEPVGRAPTKGSARPSATEGPPGTAAPVPPPPALDAGDEATEASDDRDDDRDDGVGGSDSD